MPQLLRQWNHARSGLEKERMGRILVFGFSHIYVGFGFSILFHFSYYLNISLGLWKIGRI